MPSRQLSFAEPLPARQISFSRELDMHFLGDLPMMPGGSWAELAEEDPEMALMGPPPFVPDFVDPEWVAPRKPARPRTALAPIGTPMRNAFAALSEPSPSAPEYDHRSGPSTQPSTASSEAPPPPTPSARTG